jgi:hypothetical protein
MTKKNIPSTVQLLETPEPYSWLSDSRWISNGKPKKKIEVAHGHTGLCQLDRPGSSPGVG